MPTVEAIRRWVAHNRHAFTEQTQAHYSSVIWRFAHAAPKFIKDLTVEHIESYIQTLLKQSAARSANSHLTCIKSFCRWYSQTYEIPNPAAKIRTLRMPPPRSRTLTQIEYEKILAVCTEWEADVINFLACTGLRKTEFISLTWDKVSSDQQYLNVFSKGKSRIVPLNKTAQAILAKYTQHKSGPIDLLKNLRSRNALYKLCVRLSRRAAIPRFGPHAIRHWHATALWRKGVPLFTIMKTLGHSSPETTLIYLHSTVEDILHVTDCLD